MEIELTKHILQRYIERFNPNLESVENIKDRFSRARQAIISILETAHYVSDDHRGVLLHSPLHRCNLIVRKRKLITLYQPEKKHVNPKRERTHAAKY